MIWILIRSRIGETRPNSFIPGVQDQRVLLAEGLAADAALEGLGARVDALVAGQLRRPRETLVAVGAPVRVLPGV